MLVAFNPFIQAERSFLRDHTWLLAASGVHHLIGLYWWEHWIRRLKSLCVNILRTIVMVNCCIPHNRPLFVRKVQPLTSVQVKSFVIRRHVTARPLPQNHQIFCPRPDPNFNKLPQLSPFSTQCATASKAWNGVIQFIPGPQYICRFSALHRALKEPTFLRGFYCRRKGTIYARCPR